jgi:excinuclease ABC subunit C
LEGLPGVSQAVAHRLLAHFGSIRALSQASLEEIAALRGVGRKNADQIFEVLRAPYRADAPAP